MYLIYKIYKEIFTDIFGEAKKNMQKHLIDSLTALVTIICLEKIITFLKWY